MSGREFQKAKNNRQFAGLEGRRELLDEESLGPVRGRRIMAVDSLTSAAVAQIASDLVWNYFVEHLEGPTRRWLLLNLHERGIRMDRAQLGRDGVPTPERLSDRCEISFDHALRLPAGRELLAPLPELLRLAAQRVLALPREERGRNHAELPFDEIERLWGDERRALLATALIKAARAGWFSGWSGSGQNRRLQNFHLNFEVVRFAAVQTLDDVEELRKSDRRMKVGKHPFGKHRLLLQRIHDNMIQNGRWPIPLDLSLDLLDLGWLPSLLRDLHEAQFVSHPFDPEPYAETRLTMNALPFVDDGTVAHRIPVVASAAAKLWLEDEDGRVPESRLLTATKLSRAELRPVLLYCRGEFWLGSGNVGATDRDWDVHCYEEVLLLEHVQSFDDYEQVRDSHTKQWQNYRFTESSEREDEAASPAQRINADLSFMMDDELRRIAQRDLADLNAGIAATSPKAAMILVGSLIEGVLLDIAARNLPRAQRVRPKLQPRDASLSELISIAVSEGLIATSTNKVASEFVRGARNWVHPFRLKADAEKPNPKLAALGMHLASAVLHDLEQAAADGKLTAFERATP